MSRAYCGNGAHPAKVSPETEFSSGQGSKRTLTALGLLELERLTAVGLSQLRIVKRLGFGSKDIFRRFCLTDPDARFAIERGKCIKKMRGNASELVLRDEDGGKTVTPAGLESIQKLTARGASDRSVASALGITVTGYRELLEHDPSAQAAADSGFADLEEKISGNLIRMSAKQAIPAIFLAKSRLNWRDQPNTEVNISGDHITFQKLVLPESMSREQFLAHGVPEFPESQPHPRPGLVAEFDLPRAK